MLLEKYHRILSVVFTGLLISIAATIIVGISKEIESVYAIVSYSSAFFFLILTWVYYKKERKAIHEASEISSDLSIEQVKVLSASKNNWISRFYNNLFKNNNKINNATALINAIANNETIEVNQENTDQLSIAIVNLQQQLKTFRNAEERRTWQAQGLARFAELLRMHNQNMKDFGFKIISEVIKYIDASQGAMFLADKEADEEYLQMIGCYAYERRKATNLRIAKGEGLLGQCLQEKDIIYITDVPEKYVRIQSGLGKALPRHILIIPLINNEVMVGALEIASFNILEQYKIDFLKDVAKNIAASISVIQVNENTQKLLNDSQHLASELQSSEEEMRQSMEELEATQEEMARNQMELNSVFSAIDNTWLKAEFNISGDLISANNKLLEFIGWTDVEAKEKTHQSICSDLSRHQEIWEYLSMGKSIQANYSTRNSKNEELWLGASYSPVLNNSGALSKVLLLGENITQKKLLEKENEKNQVELMNHMEAINKTIASLEFDNTGKIIHANDIYLSITGFNLKEIKGKSYFDLLPEKDRLKPQYQLMWESLKEGKFFSGEFKQTDSTGHEMWLSGTLNPIYDSNENLNKVMLLAQFTTKSKQKLNELSGSVTAMKGVIPILELNKDFTLKNANPLFFEATGYSRMSLKNVNYSENFKLGANWTNEKILSELENGKKVETEVQFKTNEGEWTSSIVSIAGVQNLDLELDKIIFLFVGMIQNSLNLKNAN